MRKNENQDLKSRISEKYHVFYDLPNLAQAPPVVKPKNKVLALIPLFSDVYRHSLDMDGLIRSALYSRWSALMYTDAVAQGVEINLYMEDTLLPSYKAVLGDNFIKASDVVYFSGASPTVHGNGTWGISVSKPARTGIYAYLTMSGLSSGTLTYFFCRVCLLFLKTC